VNTGTEYEDVLMRNQEYAAEIKRLTDELAATKDRLAETEDDIRLLLKFHRDIMAERDTARKELMMWFGERCSKKELKQEYKNRGWEYLKEM
jgi:hypothetical protein